MSSSSIRDVPVKLHIGFDDTDSPQGGCTSYVAARLAQTLVRLGAKFLDYPNLIRLNPNVPWKTRGNAAVALRVEILREAYNQIREQVVSVVERLSSLGERGTDPGIVLYQGDIPEQLVGFSSKAMTSIVSLEEALGVIRSCGAEAVGFGTGLGIIGALAAIGNVLDGDHTFELITYRSPCMSRRIRQISRGSVMKMDRLFEDETFNNIDYESGRVLITPHGADPIICGIRGEDPSLLRKALDVLEVEDNIERWIIFRTNQGTDQHLGTFSKILDATPYASVVLQGDVSSNPKTIPGGHVIFSVSDGTGEIECAVYEPAGDLRKTAACLRKGDEITIFGGVRPLTDGRLTVNVEKLLISRVTRAIRLSNPRCITCQKRMKSAGRFQDYRCERCRLLMPKTKKEETELKRTISEGLYVPPPRAQRHLTKPLQRYGKEKLSFDGLVVDPWHYP